MTNDGLVNEVDDVDVVVHAIQQEIVLASGADAVGGKPSTQRIAGSRFRRKNARRKTSQICERFAGRLAVICDTADEFRCRQSTVDSVCSSGAEAVTSTVWLQCQPAARYSRRMRRPIDDHAFLLRLLEPGCFNR